MAFTTRVSVLVPQFSDDGEEICPLCCTEAKAWCVGSCDHYVCLKCSVRLRVLCEKKECPVCREKNDKVVVFRSPQPYSIPRQFLPDKKHGFLFPKSSLANLYDDIRAIRCQVCDKRGMTNMRQLTEHLRRDHTLFTCDICVEHLKLFSHEHKVYTRQELVRHRREGDPDDKSHKGHPQCEFCDERYFGKDELFYHLKENHFWCHFCEQSQGNQEYYPSYELLRRHFRSDHFLCEEGPCRNEKYTNVFLSKLDMQVHKAKVHTKGLSKTEAKQLRHVDVGFTYTRKERVEEPPVHRRGHRYHHHNGTGTFDKDMELAISASINSCNVQQQQQEEVVTKKETSHGHNNIHTTLKGGGVVIENKPHPVTSDSNSPPQQVKKKPTLPPPGLEHVTPTVESHDEDKDSARDDWPSLGLEQTRTKTQQTQSHTRPPPGVLAPPPGFSCPPPPGLDTVKSSISEYDILQEAVKILKNDTEKVNNFKAISGQFQKGRMNVVDYNNKCIALFGSDWIEFGIRLASTLPNEEKKHELLSRLISNGGAQGYTPKPPPGFTSTQTLSSTKENNGSKKNTKKRNRNGGGNQPKGAWQSGRHLDSGSILQEAEFPSLNPPTIIPTTSRTRGGEGALGHGRSAWSMKVAATVK